MRRLICWVFLLIIAGPQAYGSGLLLPRDGSAPIQVQSHRVEATLEDGLARTTLRQTFVNPHARALEAVYVFPLPESAALIDLAMEVGGQRLEGFLAERQMARRAYNSIKRRGLDPALVEQIGRSTFRLSVFPVLPGKETVIELTWIESIPLVQGEYTYVYPLGLEGEQAATQQDFTFTLQVRSSVPLESIRSPHQDVLCRQRTELEGSASLERMRAILSEDVVITTRLSCVAATLHVRLYKPPVGDPYFAAVVTPPSLSEEEVLPRDMTLVLDVSGSMKGTKIDQARRAGLWLVDHLRARDRINILLFNNDVRGFREKPVSATQENRKRLREFLQEATTGGGTALGDAIDRACEAPKEPGRAAMVVVLTDGLPTIGEKKPKNIIASAGEARKRGLRIYTFGVGQDVDQWLLEGVATGGGGVSEVFRVGGEIQSRMKSFLSRTSSPAIVDLDVSLDGERIEDLQPRPLRDIYVGEQATLTGRLRGEGQKTLAVTGFLNGEKIRLESAIDLGPSLNLRGKNSMARDLYARAKLDFLERALRLRRGLKDDAYFEALDRGRYSTEDELVSAMIDLSLETGVQCAYTSLFALVPEDRNSLNPRDAVGLKNAMERAQRRRHELASPLIVDDDSHQETLDFFEQGNSKIGPSSGVGSSTRSDIPSVKARPRVEASNGPRIGDSRPLGNPGGPGTPGPGAPRTGGRPGAGTTGGPRLPGGRQVAGIGGMVRRQRAVSFDHWEFWWAHNKEPIVLSRTGVHRERVSPEFVERRILPVLLEALESNDHGDILDSAVIAMARSVRPESVHLAINAIIKLLRHSEESVKQSAVLALGILRSEQSRSYLRDLVEDNDRGRALLSEGGLDAVPHVLQAFAAIGLGLIGHPGDIDFLMRAVDSSAYKRWELQTCGLLALGMYEEASDKVLPFLIAMLHTRRLDPQIRSFAPIAISRLGPAAKSALPSLIAKLNDEQSGRRMVQSCVIGIGRIADLDAEVIASLSHQIYHCWDRQTRSFAYMALGEIGSRTPIADAKEAHQVLRDFLSESVIRPPESIQAPYASLALALYAHAHCDIDPKVSFDSAERILLGFQLNLNPSSRGGMAIALGVLEARESGPVLHRALTQSKNEEFAGYVALALGLMKYEPALVDIRRLMAQDDIEFKFRIQLARSLALLEDFESLDLLMDRIGKSKTISEVASVCQAIGWLGDSRAVAPLLAMVEDDREKDLVRAFAIVGLGLLGERGGRPWNAEFGCGLNYRAKTDAIAEILDIL